MPTSTPAEAYASIKLNELVHRTSAEACCNGRLGKRFGDDAYAMERFVAELGAAFLCADLRITDAPRPDHARYLESCLQVLMADKKAIFFCFEGLRSRCASRNPPGRVSASSPSLPACVYLAIRGFDDYVKSIVTCKLVEAGGAGVNFMM